MEKWSIILVGTSEGASGVSGTIKIEEGVVVMPTRTINLRQPSKSKKGWHYLNDTFRAPYFFTTDYFFYQLVTTQGEGSFKQTKIARA
jgi:hypothetical protein